MRIEIYTNHKNFASYMLEESSASSESEIEIIEGVKLVYKDTIIRLGAEFPDIVGFALEFLKEVEVVIVAHWLFEKLKDCQVRQLVIGGIKTKVSVKQIEKAINEHIKIFSGDNRIAQKQLFEAMKSFKESEGRANFYDLSVNLMEGGFELQAYLLLLAIWNTGNFRFYANRFDIKNFKETLELLESPFHKVEGHDIRTIDLEYYRDEIKIIYGTLSHIEGVGDTGASKIMHLKNRKVFIMWDSYIRGEKLWRYYKRIGLVKQYGWVLKYEKHSESYFQFLRHMKHLFSNVQLSGNEGKTLAKAIDEFNYANITLPIQELEKKDRKKKKKE